MAGVAFHKFVLGAVGKTDGSDATKVRPSNWDSEHTFAGGANGNVLVRDSGESDGARWTDTPRLASLGLGASGYLGLGGVTPGSSGYGLRDNGGVVEVKNSGLGWYPVGQIFDRNTTVVSFNTTNAEQTAYSVNVPSNTLGTNRRLWIYAQGFASNTSGSTCAYTVRLKYGGTTVISAGAPGLVNGLSNQGFSIPFYLNALGSTSSQSGFGATIIGQSTIFHQYGTAAEDSTQDKTLTITVQMSVSNANALWTINHVVVVLL